MYKRRLIDDVLKFYKNSRYALLLEGAKGTGKTSTCKQLTEAHFYLDNSVTKELVETNPQIIFEDNKSVLIDEWQRIPSIWDTVRRKVDDGYEGSILLTGSSPSLHPYVHSGAGRILRFKLRPLSIEEREIEEPKVRISKLLNQDLEENFTYSTDITINTYIDEIFSSGYPEFRNESERLRAKSLQSYINNLIQHDFLEHEVSVRKPEALKSWLSAFSAATATNATDAAIARAAFSDKEEQLSRITIANYKEVLQGLGIIEEVPTWLPLGSLFTNLGKSSKHFLVDPALAVSLLKISKANLMKGRKIPKTVGKLNKTFLGQLFESLVYQSLAVYCEVNEIDLSHLRLRGGEKEIDFIIQKEDLLIAIEVKSKALTEEKDVKNLNWFEEKVKEEYDVIKLVINAGQYAYKRKDGVLVVPLALLGC